MPSLSTTIEDNSPLIWYSAGWRAGSSQTDSLASLYSHSNFMATQTTGASASFQFTGTGVQIFGAKRGNHGLYQITVDNTALSPSDGFASDPGLFQQMLFSKTDLQQGTHVINITNLGTKGQYVDVDFITYTTNIDGTGDKIYVNTLHNNDPVFAYLPSDSIWTNPPNGASYASGTGRVTSTNGSSVQFTFTGRSVGLYGFVGPSGSQYTIQLDDSRIQTYNSTQDRIDSSVLLYRADGLRDSQHKLTLTCVTTAPGQTLSFDYANIYFLNPSQINQTAAHSSRKVDGAAIAAIVLGVVVFLLLLVLAFIGYRYRKERNGALGAKSETLTPTPFSTMATATSMRQSDQLQSTLHRTNNSFSNISESSTSSSAGMQWRTAMTPVPSKAVSLIAAQRRAEASTLRQVAGVLPSNRPVDQHVQDDESLSALSPASVSETLPPDYGQATGIYRSRPV